MKVNAALIGSGNIGTDLMYKAMRSEWINPVRMVSIDPESDGLARARDAGMKTTHEGVDGLLPHIEADDIKIAFDATSAYVEAGQAMLAYEPAMREVMLSSDTRFAIEDVSDLPWIEIDFPEDLERAGREILPRLVEP